MKRELLKVYAITDRTCMGQDFEKKIEQALQGGVTCLQLREKNMPEEQLIKEAVRIKAICRKYGVPLILNDNCHAALKAGADGVHVGQSDMPVSEIRRLAGAHFLIGATTLRITPELLREICHSVTIPAVAIGGIAAENMMTLQDSGIAGVAVVSAVFGAEDVRAAAAQLCRKREEML